MTSRAREPHAETAATRARANNVLKAFPMAAYSALETTRKDRTDMGFPCSAEA